MIIMISSNPIWHSPERQIATTLLHEALAAEVHEGPMNTTDSNPSNIDEYETLNDVLVTGTNDESDANDDPTNMTTQIDGIPRDVVISLERLQEKLKGNINYTS